MKHRLIRHDKFMWCIVLLMPTISMVIALLCGQQSLLHLLSTDWELNRIVIFDIRLPRVLSAGLVGGLLAISGVLIQSIVRNPLADPGLIGVSGGAAIAASGWVLIASSSTFLVSMQPIFAMLGGALALMFVMSLGASARYSMASPTAYHLILAGIAVNVLAAALMGLISYTATDEQLRLITLWSMGSVMAADWRWVGLLGFVLSTGLIFWSKRTRALDVMLLGDVEARSLGISVSSLRRITLYSVAIFVGVSVSLSGIIGFIGLVSPHIARMLVGALHRRVIPVTVSLGASLVMLADAFSRTIVAPAELPIGIVTTLVGAPIFISLLFHDRQRS